MLGVEGGQIRDQDILYHCDRKFKIFSRVTLELFCLNSGDRPRTIGLEAVNRFGFNKRKKFCLC